MAFQLIHHIDMRMITQAACFSIDFILRRFVSTLTGICVFWRRSNDDLELQEGCRLQDIGVFGLCSVRVTLGVHF